MYIDSGVPYEVCIYILMNIANKKHYLVLQNYLTPVNIVVDSLLDIIFYIPLTVRTL